MCIVALNWQPHSVTPLLLLNNRDEFYARKTLPLHYIAPQNATQQGYYAGIDEQAGGTWLGVANNGQWAVLTNFREGSAQKNNRQQSRGLLVSHYLNTVQNPLNYMSQIQPQNYMGFNLIVGNLTEAFVLSNKGQHANQIIPLSQGLSVLSNANLNTPWFKSQLLKQLLEEKILPTQQVVTNIQIKQMNTAAFKILSNTQKAKLAQLPKTGVPMLMEKMLSSIFINSPVYGTCSSTVLVVQQNGVYMTEKNHTHHHVITQHEWQLS